MDKVKFFYTPALQVRSFNLVCDANGEVIEYIPPFDGTFVKNLPRMAVCSVWDTDNDTLAFGSCVCSEKDEFDKDTAQLLSYMRAKSKPIVTICIGPESDVAVLSKRYVNKIINGEI